MYLNLWGANYIFINLLVFHLYFYNIMFKISKYCKIFIFKISFNKKKREDYLFLYAIQY